MLTSLYTPSASLAQNLTTSNLAVKFILTEDEKYKDDKEAVKRIFRFNESSGYSQVTAKAPEIKKLYNMAYGKVDPADYMEVETDYANMVGAAPKLEVDSLDFYPIIPTLVRGIVNSYEKSYTEYVAQAVNPEVTNDIWDRLNNDLRSNLIQNVEALFQMETMEDTPDVQEQKYKLLMESERVQSYYKKDYRTTVEQWAQRTMNLEDEQFQMKLIEKMAVEQIVVTEEPCIHVNYADGNYYPEIWDEKDTYSIRAPKSRDYSEALVVGNFEYCTFADILNKYSHNMEPEQIEKVSAWSQTMQGDSFVVNGMLPHFNKAQKYEESRNNYLQVESVLRFDASRTMWKETGLSGDLVRVSTQYFYVPRKVATLTVKNPGSPDFTDMVDEQFKATIKPVYKKGFPKTAENLVSGEHLEWFYIPELWRGRKMSTWGVKPDMFLADNPAFKDNEIWLELDRFEIQYSDPYQKYGIYIPVHGGSVTNQYAEAASVVKICSPWQIQFTWIHNRNKQLLATEIGKFFLMPSSLIPNQSLEGEWDLNSLENFAVTARDTGLAPTANPLEQGGNASLALQGGYGQVVDLTKTSEILEKTNLAALIKQECYHSIGLTPDFLLGDFSPSQSAKSVAMGQQRSATQISGIFSRLGEIMVKVRTTMLTTAQFIASKKPTVQMQFNTAEEGRVLFRASTEDFLLHKLGIFPKSNGSDLAVIQSIKDYVAVNNTIGADSEEMATLFAFKSLPELFTKLKEVQVRKDSEKQKDFERQQALQQQQIQAAQQAQQVAIEERDKEKALDRERDIMVAQIKSLGYAEGTADDIQSSILKLQTANDTQKSLYDRAEMDYRMQASKERQIELDNVRKAADSGLKQRVELKKLEQRDKELVLYEKEIEARNTRSKAID